MFRKIIQKQGVPVSVCIGRRVREKLIKEVTVGLNCLAMSATEWTVTMTENTV